MITHQKNTLAIVQINFRILDIFFKYMNEDENKKLLDKFAPIYNEKNGKISLAKSIKKNRPNQFQNVLLKKQILDLKRQLQKEKVKSQEVNILALQIKQIKQKIADKIKVKREHQRTTFYQQQFNLRRPIKQQEGQKSSLQGNIESVQMQKSQRTIKKQSLNMSNSIPNTLQSQIYWNNFPLNQSKTFYQYMDQKSSQSQKYSSHQSKKLSNIGSVKLKKSNSINTRLNNLKRLRQQNLDSLNQYKKS